MIDKRTTGFIQIIKFVKRLLTNYKVSCKVFHYIDVFVTTMTSQITSLTVFTQPFLQTQIKENIKAPRHWPLCGEITGTDEFPAQRASNAENVSIWWRHHVLLAFRHDTCVVCVVTTHMQAICLEQYLRFTMSCVGYEIKKTLYVRVIQDMPLTICQYICAFGHTPFL